MGKGGNEPVWPATWLGRLGSARIEERRERASDPDSSAALPPRRRTRAGLCVANEGRQHRKGKLKVSRVNSGVEKARADGIARAKYPLALGAEQNELVGRG